MDLDTKIMSLCALELILHAPISPLAAILKKRAVMDELLQKCLGSKPKMVRNDLYLPRKIFALLSSQSPPKSLATLLTILSLY